MLVKHMLFCKLRFLDMQKDACMHARRILKSVLHNAAKDRSFSLNEVAKAHEYLEKGRATGKVLIEIGTITE